ncbi:class I SAM-dependent methyltransferase [Gammaproteobacteria bacterium]|jgi:hypothetical protein|nr:class I SAM-dependent methyltransferase [Gammaproteobacteria bacterium]
MMKTIVTEYKFPQKIYFEKILKRICIFILESSFTKPKVIDFGCGNSTLESFLIKQDPSVSITGYDIDPNLSKISNPFLVSYDMWVFNHVLMYMNQTEIENLFREIKRLNQDALLIIGLSRQNFISKFGAFFLNPEAHDGTISSYETQRKFIDLELEICSLERIFFMTDLFVCKFKDTKSS